MDGNDGDLGVTIGQLARRTGLSVKTIRWFKPGARPTGRPDGVWPGLTGGRAVWQLLGIIYGWPPIPTVVQAFE